MENGIIRISAMKEKIEETARARYSAAYPMGREFGDELYHIDRNARANLVKLFVFQDLSIS